MRLQAQANPNPAVSSESLGHAATLSERDPVIQECMEARVRLQKVRQRNGGLLLVRQEFAHNGPPALSDFACQLYILYFTSLSCHRYINALEAASANFASNIDREMLRKGDELTAALKSKKRHSNSGSL